MKIPKRLIFCCTLVLLIGGAAGNNRAVAQQVKVTDPASIVLVVARDSNEIVFMDIKTNAIVGQEQASDHPGRAFIAVDESVVLRQAKSVGSRQSRSVGFAIDRQVLRARQGGLDRALVTHALAAAVLRQLPIMDGVDHLH